MKSPQIKWISRHDPPEAFPDPAQAFDVPDGLLAAGGDLSAERLLYAYRHGIFPWFEEGQPILWWSPDPRCVLRPANFHLSRRLARYFRHAEFEITVNAAFTRIVDECAADRPGQQGTWITPGMKKAYGDLHRAGWAHSVEIWSGDELAGGLYGLAIGRAFFGESMFSTRSNGSKAALFALCRALAASDFGLLDCQVESPHLLSLGAVSIPRAQFLGEIARLCDEAVPFAGFSQTRTGLAELLG